jgi:hypothetical protein
LQKRFNGDFYIPNSVRDELVTNPLQTRRFKLEAIMIDKLIFDKVLNVYSPLNVDSLLELVNSIYVANGRPIHILDRAEIEALDLVLRLRADSYVVDERTMRLLIESPNSLRKLLERKLHTSVKMDNKLANEFLNIARGIKVIRSVELMVVAFEIGLLNNLVSPNHSSADILEGLLWGLRMRGCSLADVEIEKILKFEAKRL